MLIYLVMGGEAYQIGGREKCIRELAGYLVNHNHRVKILCRMGKMYTTDEVSDSSLIKKVTVSHSSRGFSLYDLVSHLPNPLSVFLGVIRLVKDYRCEDDRSRVLHAHDLSSSFLIAIYMRRIFKLPFVVQIHGFPLREQYIKLVSAESPLFSFLWFLTKTWHSIAISLMRVNSGLILVNNGEVKAFYESCGILSNKLKIIPSGINIQEHEEKLLLTNNAKACMGITESDEGVTIGFVGRLVPEKNVETLIKAFKGSVKDNPDIKTRLVIIGDGPMRHLLEETVEKYDLGSQVLFLGFIPDAYRFLNALDIFVLPSFIEGSPMSLIEAMANGRSIIASDIPAIREMVENEKEALLFDPNDPEQLKTAILTLYNSPELRKKLGEGAINKAMQYDVNIVFSNILRTYREILKDRA